MEETLCIFLLISQLSVAVSGTLVVNVAQTFYQAEENHHITLEWTFTPKTLSSSNIYILCELLTDQKVSKVLFQLHEGVEVSESQDEQFSGRVQFDKDVLREGRLRLDVSRLRTEDSGLYLCEVNTESGSSSDKCRLNVTATHQLTCQTEPIQAEEGGDVSLQCRLDPSVDLRKETLDFTRADLNREDDVVHSYRHEKDQTDPQMDQYRGRTTLIHEDLIRGIISLNISSLTLTDSGLYTCYVPDLEAYCTITLTVVRKDQDNRTNTTIIEPEKPGAEKMNVGAIVGGVLTVVALILVLIILRVLVKPRNLWMKKKQEAEKTPNISEMEKLETTSTEGDEELQKMILETS
ncbi:junctional adhesion molecule C isoform X5 [Lates calcarifer]|uniref:Junctional adhesion molecule C isoform X5 n=1 Tax=Lates calcarifer TaxID=8187 RepID=A0AAJ8B1J8_LATCA|nr:junctional adhesion molecule C isoform X5 [Lates calcarifer]